MSNLLREQYLKSAWDPYPSAPEGTVSVAQLAHGKNASWVGGQVVDVSSHHLTLQSMGISKTWNSSAVNLHEVLREGDQIAVHDNGKTLDVVLLAPRLKSLNPTKLTPELARQWQSFLYRVRQFFNDDGFLEVQTPSLVSCPGFEPSLEPFQVTLKRGRVSTPLFLPTSPELHLKKLWSQGWTEIFEMRSCFRNDEFSLQHQPEFVMLEWYRAFGRIENLSDDLVRLIKAVAEDAQPLTVRHLQVSELFESILNFKLKPDTQEHELRHIFSSHRSELSNENEEWNDLFHRLWVDHIDPWLARQEGLILVRNFPPSQAALARLNSEGWAERLELYWNGLEIANGFNELNHPEQQRSRALKDVAERSRLRKTSIQMDEDFFTALESGMAPGVGMALGLERLFMALNKIDDIQKIKAFTYGESR